MKRDIAFGIVGGDRRQAYLARSIMRDGYQVYVSCLEKCEEASELYYLPLEKVGEGCSKIILPLPALNGENLNAPYSKEKVRADEGFAGHFEDCTVYGGMMQNLYKTCGLWDRIKSFDYFQRDELLEGNAALTAEGALALLIERYSGSVFGSRVLVCGYGRIGSALTEKLYALGAAVECAARSRKAFAKITSRGIKALEYKDIKGRYDVIINTVPAKVVTPVILSRQDRETFVLELASAPGGIDREAAMRLGINVTDGASLPGRFSPKSSAELIKETIYNMMEEF